MNWQRDLRIRRNQPLKDKTTIKIGGKAQFFSAPKDPARLKKLLLWANKNGLPVLVIGAGSNLLINDKGIRGLVIKLNSGYFKKVVFKGDSTKAGSGVMLAWLISLALRESLGKLEFLTGIPGTLGGALAMNAGCWGKDIGSLVREIEVMDSRGNIKYLNKKEAGFNYRKSGLGKYIILSAKLKLKKSTKELIRANIKEYVLKRHRSLDLTFYNAGCIFKNPIRMHAGKLIDLCGLKGKRAGGAVISAKHANFILNKGNAKYSQVLSLMKLIRLKVKKKFKVNLEPEIRIWE